MPAWKEARPGTLLNSSSSLEQARMTQPSANASTWQLDSLTGKRVGRFLVRERLGGGGMGEVYRAEDTVLKRSVALKRVAPHLRSDLLYRQRFLREAERASRFSDPHIAAIYDVLEDNGEAFLVMEYVEGQTLRRRLSQPLQLGHIFHIVLQCAEGLAVSHSHGVVHCDIKPENIMLTTDGQVKILDFGVAKRLPSSDQSITLEKSQTLSGTPGYMAPEVLLENVPDGRADIFSLGVVLYEALTSYQPFRASSFVATSERVLREIPSPVTMLNPKLPPELNRLIAKMLAKNPSERFQSAQEVKTEISRLQEEIDGLGMTALPPRSTTGQTPLPQQPSKVRYLGLTLLAATLLLLSMAIVWQRAYRPSHAAKIFPARSSLLISDFETADHALPEAGLREGLTIALQQSRYVNVYPRSRVYEVLERMKRTNVRGIDESLGREICQRENVRTLLVGSIVRIGDIIQISVRAVDPAQGNVLFAEKIRLANNTEFFDKVDWLARRVREDLGESIPAIENSSRPLAKVTTSSLTALQLYSQATDAFGLGKLEEVPPLLQSALDLDPEFAMAHHLLSQIYEIMGNRAKEQEEVKRAYALRQSVTERERRLIEASYYNLTAMIAVPSMPCSP